MPHQIPSIVRYWPLADNRYIFENIAAFSWSGHFVINLKGTVYKARPIQYPGDTNTSYDPTGHALIQVVGDYRYRELSAVQLTAVIQLSAMLARRHDVPVSDIRGHLDYAPGETDCPGENIYRYLRDGTINNGVAELLSVDRRF